MNYRWRTVLIALAIVLGAAFEVIKGFEPDSEPAKISAQELNGMKLQSFNVKKFDQRRHSKKRFNRATPKFAKFDSAKFPQEHSFDEAKKKKLAKKDAKKAETEKKKKAEEEKKKKEAEEKAKQAKKDAEALEEPYMYPEDEEDYSNSDNNTTEEVVDGGGAFAPPAEEPFSGIPTTFEQWYPLVVDRVSADNANKLVEYYHSRLVSKEVFYQLIYAMFNENRDEIRKQGAHIAASVRSPESFQALAYAMEQEPQGSPLRNYIKIQVNQYQNPSHLMNLKVVLMTTESDFTATLAATIIEQAAKLHLKPIAGSGPSPASEGENIANKDLFTDLQSLLQDFVSQSVFKGQFLNAANNAIDQINDGLNG